MRQPRLAGTILWGETRHYGFSPPGVCRGDRGRAILQGLGPQPWSQVGGSKGPLQQVRQRRGGPDWYAWEAGKCGPCRHLVAGAFRCWEAEWWAVPANLERWQWVFLLSVQLRKTQSHSLENAHPTRSCITDTLILCLCCMRKFLQCRKFWRIPKTTALF